MPRSTYQAPAALTHIDVVRNAASSMCSQRRRNTELVMIVVQSLGTNLPSTVCWPSGTCIQVLFARIQKDENKVPIDTMQQAKKYTPGGTRSRPSSITPRKVASCRNPVNVS